MRYIDKKNIPDYFNEEVNLLKNQFKNKNIKVRDIFDSLECKSEIHDYMLFSEQNGLCGYCEAKIENVENSHIEHIEAINEDKNREKAEELVFDYNNLIVSCNGVCFSGKKRITCGHKKDTKGFKPNYEDFLSPTKIENIRDYFKYIQGSGFIGATSLDNKKAIHTLEVLNLNSPNNYLPEARKKALTEFKSAVEKAVKNKKQSKEKIIKFLLDRENLAFISFLRFVYIKILHDHRTN